MALKDLVASKATLTEAAIEGIVAEYVHYDVDHKEVALSSAGAALPAKKKLLVYLVALQGWPFVTHESVPSDASPSQIAADLGLPGGTVRPMLMDLVDRHLITAQSGRYSARAANLPSIKKALSGDTLVGGERKAGRARSEANDNAVAGTALRRKGGGTKTGGPAAKFEGWLNGSFFNHPRTLGDVKNKFRQEGIIIPRTSLPQMLLKAVRQGRLARKEATVEGRNVWVYERAGG